MEVEAAKLIGAGLAVVGVYRIRYRYRQHFLVIHHRCGS